MAAVSVVRVGERTKERLDRLKLHPRETYDDVIARLTDMAIDVSCSYLLLRGAQDDARRLLAAEYFVAAATARVEGAAAQVVGGDPSVLDALNALTAG